VSQAPAFQNSTIQVDALPSVGEVDLHPLAPRYAAALQLALAVGIGVGWALTLAIDLLGKTLLAPLTTPGTLSLAWVAVWLAAGLWTAAAVKMKGYRLREHDVIYRSGVIWRKWIAVPINRIQHVESHQGPLDRLFGLAALHIFTAGATRVDLRIPGLSADEAERLLHFLLERTGPSDEQE